MATLLTATFKMALHLRWLTTEKFQNYETVKDGCIPNKNKFKTQKANKLRWLAADIKFQTATRLDVLALMVIYLYSTTVFYRVNLRYMTL